MAPLHDPAAAIRKSLSASIHAAARDDGTPPDVLYACGVVTFFRVDAVRHGTNYRAMARNAFSTLAIGTDGHWDPAWRAVVRGVVAFMIENGHEFESAAHIPRLQAMAAEKPQPKKLEEWFDRVFPI